ncbi:MAG: 2-C-methyl-D-erythritol 2,4-cyclodiphosphate synthase [Magnetococcales bacterium]|nr:2-C-methyl-D-erythritol 2,4-cyclodiphosphate synthase [Magnetococcales bacterium]
MIVVAAGQGRRFGGALPKQYQNLAGRPILAHAVERLHAHPLIQTILPVIAPDGDALWHAIMGPYLANWPKLLPPVPGEAERQGSVFNGLTHLELSDQAWVGIHDGARPLPSQELLDRLFQARNQADVIIPAILIHDTIKMVDESNHIQETLDRSTLRRIQTPQLFRYGRLLQRHQEAKQQGFLGTDDASLSEQAGDPVFTVLGDEENLKITRLQDLSLAEHFLHTRKPTMKMRIGQGFDVHRFTKDRPLFLGGIPIPHDQGLLGHSDADVLLHAIMDALLGAAGLRDIGHHFPDTDPQYRGADSKDLLRSVNRALQERGYGVTNLDATVICEAPRLAAFIPTMITTIADILNISPTQVNIKATTTEKLGFTGRREGIAAQAITLLTDLGGVDNG